MSGANKIISATACRRQASLYEGKAKAEPRPGMRTALLTVSRDWLEIADKIELLVIVGEINSVPEMRSSDLLAEGDITQLLNTPEPKR